MAAAASSKLEKCSHFFGIIQAIATTAALGLGAWWFIEQRQTYPHAQLEQTVEAVPVRPGLIAVEAHVQFENKGLTRIQLWRANVKLQDVSDQPYAYGDLARLTGRSYWEAARPGDTQHIPQFHEGELRWPVMNQFNGPVHNLIEPGETDILVFTFLIPCESIAIGNSKKLHFIRIATDIPKPKGSGPDDFAWKARTFSNVANACAGRGGER